MAAASPSRAPEVKRLYKTGFEYFRTRCKAAFQRKQGLTDAGEIERALQHGQYVVKELEALYYLRKYREMKRRYEGPSDAPTIADETTWLRPTSESAPAAPR